MVKLENIGIKKGIKKLRKIEPDNIILQQNIRQN